MGTLEAVVTDEFPPFHGSCPVCRSGGPVPFVALAARRYWRCPLCMATILDPRQRPSRDAERLHYRQHDNRPDDPLYRSFLARLAEPLMALLEPGSAGLDYGFGPGPALAAMLREAGLAVALYDPCFHPDAAVLGRRCDFIACTETTEHFHRPADEFDRLAWLVRPGGWLAVMTCFQTDDARFADWHYRRDPTHVVFYREATLRRVAASRGLFCEIPVKDVALMRRPSERSSVP